MRESLKILDEIPVIVERLKKIEDEIRDSAEKIAVISELCEKRINTDGESFHKIYSGLTEALECLVEYRSKAEDLINLVKIKRLRNPARWKRSKLTEGL